MSQKKSLILKLFGMEIEKQQATEWSLESADYMAAYYEAMAKRADQLSAYNGEEMDAIFAIVCRGATDHIDQAEVSNWAQLFFLWHALFAPYKEEQRAYYNADRIISQFKKSARDYMEVATYGFVVPNPSVYLELLKMDVEIAQTYYKHCALYIYANVDNEPFLANFVEREAA